MLNGKVKWFDSKKGYGFILHEGKEIFVHYSQILAVVGGQRILCENEPVDFETSEGKKGPQAINVRRLDPPAGTVRQPVNYNRFKNNESNYDDNNYESNYDDGSNKDSKDFDHDNKDVEFDYNAGYDNKGNR